MPMILLMPPMLIPIMLRNMPKTDSDADTQKAADANKYLSAMLMLMLRVQMIIAIPMKLSHNEKSLKISLDIS